MAGIRLNTAVRIAIGIAQVGFGLAMVWGCKHFIDVTIHTGSDGDLYRMIALLVAIVLTNIALRQAFYYMSVQAEAVQSNAIRLRLFSHLFHSRLFDDREMHSGDITSRLERDVSTVSDTTTSLIPSFIITSVQLAGAFLMMQYMDARLAWALLVFTPLFVILGKLFARRLRQMTHDIRQQDSRIQMLIQEGMEHNTVLRSLESSDWVTERLDAMQDGLTAKIRRRTRFTLISRSLLATTFGMGYLIAFIWGGLQLRDGVITFGVMTSFLQLVGQIQHPILSLLTLVPQLIHTSASIDRLEELAAKPSETTDGEYLSDNGMTGVEVHEVSFRYAYGDRQILNRFSHDFRPGSKTAILGRTGAGKTTLFRLMLALTEPQEGTLSVYNANQRCPISTATRRHFVFVPQGNTLLSGTIRYNLLLARPDATEAEMRQALHTACADFVAELPE